MIRERRRCLGRMEGGGHRPAADAAEDDAPERGTEAGRRARHEGRGGIAPARQDRLLAGDQDRGAVAGLPQRLLRIGLDAGAFQPVDDEAE